MAARVRPLEALTGDAARRRPRRAGGAAEDDRRGPGPAEAPARVEHGRGAARAGARAHRGAQAPWPLPATPRPAPGAFSGKTERAGVGSGTQRIRRVAATGAAGRRGQERRLGVVARRRRRGWQGGASWWPSPKISTPARFSAVDLVRRALGRARRARRAAVPEHGPGRGPDASRAVRRSRRSKAGHARCLARFAAAMRASPPLGAPRLLARLPPWTRSPAPASPHAREDAREGLSTRPA